MERMSENIKDMVPWFGFMVRTSQSGLCALQIGGFLVVMMFGREDGSDTHADDALRF